MKPMTLKLDPENEWVGTFSIHGKEFSAPVGINSKYENKGTGKTTYDLGFQVNRNAIGAAHLFKPEMPLANSLISIAHDYLILAAVVIEVQDYEGKVTVSPCHDEDEHESVEITIPGELLTIKG